MAYGRPTVALQSWPGKVAFLLFFSLIYLGSLLLGRYFIHFANSLIVPWFATGISISFYLITRRNMWHALFIISIIAHIVAYSALPILGGYFTPDIFFAAGNILSGLVLFIYILIDVLMPLIASLILVKLLSGMLIESFRNTIIFISTCLFLDIIFTILIISISFWLIPNYNILDSIFIYLLPNIISYLVIVPLFLGMFTLKKEEWSNAPARRILEAAALMLLLPLLAYFVFSYLNNEYLLLLMFSIFAYLLILWSSLRFHPRVTATVMFELFCILLVTTLHRFSATNTAASLPRPDIVTQMLFIIIVIYSLVLSAIVHERKVYSASLQAANLRLQSSNEDLRAFEYSVSNTLQVPLRHIHGYASMLVESAGTALKEKDRRFLDKILEKTSDQKKIIDALLGLSRASWQPMVLGWHDIGQIAVQEAEKIISPGEGAEADVIAREAIPVKCDLVLMKIALYNLVDNAIKFRKPGARAKIEIGKDESPSGDVFFVRDNGVGMDEGRLKNAFIPFHNFQMARDSSGLGLGLAVTKRIINRHGGTIWIESKPNAGTTLYFTLSS